MSVKLHGREVNATAEPTRGGFFIRCSLTDGDGLEVGSVVEVDGVNYSARYVIAGSAGEPEVWAIVAPAGVPASRQRALQGSGAR